MDASALDADVLAHVLHAAAEATAPASLQPTPPFCVLIAGSGGDERKELRTLLEADARFSPCTEASDAPAAIALALRRQLNLCLIDTDIPGSGIRASREITSRLPATKVLLRTRSHDDRELIAGLEAGACGYLATDTDPSRLPEVLARAIGGEAVIPRALMSRVIQGFHATLPRRRVPALADGDIALTSREWEVFDLLCQGRSSAEIADELVVSKATVRSHVSSIVHKLGVSDRAAAIALCGRLRGLD
jgi:DNA-binding NarL/FixJ family response regulator